MTAALSIPVKIEPAAAIAVTMERGRLDLIDRYADPWRDLCARAVSRQPFFRPEWVRAYVRAFAPQANISLVTAHADGKLCFVLPLIEEKTTFCKIPVRRLRAPVDHRGCRFDGVREESLNGDLALRAVWNYLAGQNQWDLLQFQDTQQDSTVGSLVSIARAEGFCTIQTHDRPNPFVPVPATPEQLERLPRSSRLRTKLRQVKREMSLQAPLHFYPVDTPDSQALQRLYALEASGWKGQAGTAILSTPETRQFYDEIANSAARFGYLSLYFLEWKDELLAAHFSLTHNGRCYSPIVAHNEKFRGLAPGHLIVREILQDCMNRGISGYDITGQDQEWKMKWTSETRAVLNHYVFRGAIGKLAYRLGSLMGSASKDSASSNSENPGQ